MGTSEEVFSKIFGHESFEQLALVFQEYKKVSGKSIEQALRSELSGDFKNALLTIGRYSIFLVGIVIINYY